MLKLGIGINRTQKKIVAGVVFDVTAQAFITAAAITDSTQQNAINDLCIGLKAASIFTKIPCLYPMVGPNSTSHTFNLINVATFQLTFVGGWTFVNGAKPNGLNAYATTNFKPLTNYTLITSRGFGWYTNDNQIINTYSLGVYESANNAYYLMSNSGANCNTGDIAANASYVPTTSIGYAVCQKFSNTDNKSYKNGVQVGTSAVLNNKDTNLQYYLGGLNGDSTAQFFSSNNLTTAHFNNDLTAGDIATLYTLLTNYNTTLLRI